MRRSSQALSDPVVDSSLVSIREAIVAATGSSLVGLYLFGSLATDDFDAGVSDIDLIAVLWDGPSEQLAQRLSRVHADLASANPEWSDRIEVIYISKQGLANCRTDPTAIAVISPGEPFHVVQAGRDWILNWYPARQHGVRLLGPSDRLVDPSDPQRRVRPGGPRVPPRVQEQDPRRRIRRIAGVRDHRHVPRLVHDQIRQTDLEARGGVLGAGGVPAVGRSDPSGA
jgi:Nucleotidyltransferase domain